MKLSTEQIMTLDRMQEMDPGFLFLTGKAGTGKSTIIREYIKENKCVVAAPTGIAAVNIGGETLHSFFGLAPKAYSPSAFSILPDWKFNGFDTLIIDEVSMVRSDLMTVVANSLKYSDRMGRFFGGKKVIVVGDMRQLPPVVNNREEEEVKFLKHHYQGNIYFHQAPIFKGIEYDKLILKNVYRQSEDLDYLKILNFIGVGQYNSEILVKLNNRISNPSEDTIWLCPTNDIVDVHNDYKLDHLDSELKIYQGLMGGSFKDKDCPSPVKLKLKNGCRVMFTKNSKQFANGELGTVEKTYNDEIVVKKDNGVTVELEKAKWEKNAYRLNKDNTLEPKGVGSFIQFPLKLAYAVTIHKSQGLTFDKAHINPGRGMFSHGQLYVALSRIRTLNGLTLESSLRGSDVIFDQTVKNHF